MDWKNMSLEFFMANRGRIIGVVCGLAFGILSLTMGFWRTVFLTLCIAVGYWLGSRKDSVTSFFNMLDRILPRIMR